MKPARGLCAQCVEEAGIAPVALPGPLSPCGDYVILDASSPNLSETVWLEIDGDGWVWCWNHGARQVPLVTLMHLESLP